jgi:hypothetical protein
VELFRAVKGNEVSVVIIFTTAKTKEQLTATQQKHWDELCTRCIRCPIGVTQDELNNHFTKITGGECTNIADKIPVQSVRAAWEHIKANGYPIRDVETESDSFVLPESDRKRVDSVRVPIDIALHEKNARIDRRTC